MTLLPALSPDQLYTVCDPASLGFTDTRGLDGIAAADLHPRAAQALHLGLDMAHPGYNLFVLGNPGSGRHALVADLLADKRQTGAPPSDWCHVNHFPDASCPRLLRLPCGRGAPLRDDMQRFVEQLTPAINAVFQSDGYRLRIEAMQEEGKQREEAALKAVGDEARAQQVGLIRTPQGFAFVPLKEGDAPLMPEEFEKLPPEAQQAYADKIQHLRERLHQCMNAFPRWRQETLARIKQAGSEALRTTVTHLVDDLKPRYADLADVGAFLDAVLQDISDSSESLRASSHSEGDTETTTYSGAISVQRYLVNLLVENPANGLRPVVHEDHPTLQNLVGRVDHLVHMGTLTSNFTLIRAGALQRANGGFLVLDALKLLSQPYAWEGLKRCLKAGQVRIESLSDLIGLGSTMQLEPEPMPLDLKIVLIGERLVYYLLAAHDPEFAQLFKVNADLEDELPRTPGNEQVCARLLASMARRAGVRPLSAAAAARAIEHAARLAHDAQRLSLQTQALDNLLREADHVAAAEHAERLERPHLDAALDAQRHRHARLRERHAEQMLRGQWLLDTQGVQVGQVNGLAVVSLGEGSFGHPVRITATVRPGEGEVLDIEREVKLGGPIHTKGVLILSSYVASRYGRHLPLSLRASLVFEQSYGGIEGDSASVAELAVLLSAIGDLALRQDLAVTGSVNQRGEVQPVGGVNEKIEGFFALCAARGLSGTQGVLIPASNVCHLMLRPEVVEAVRAGQFHVWPMQTVDQALEHLSGLPAGTLDAQGHAPEGSVQARVMAGLRHGQQRRQAFAQPPKTPGRAKRRERPAKR